MSESRKWKYYTAGCYYKQTKKAGIFSGDPEGYWALMLDHEHRLADGLDYMGSLGF